MTNFEKIKSMSVEEMAEQLSYIIECDDCPVEKAGGCSHLTICNYKNCENRFKQWIKSEVVEKYHKKHYCEDFGQALDWIEDE